MKIEALIKSLKSKFVKNVSTMLAGNIVAQAVTLLAAPVITRLYLPDDFGIMAFIQSVGSVFAIIACLRYRYAILLPKEEKGYNLFALSIFLSFTFSILLVFLVLLFKEIIAEKCGFPSRENYLFFLPCIVFITSGRDALSFLFTRFKNFKIISISRISLSVVNSITKIGAGFLLSASAFWLLFGNLMGVLAPVLLFLIFLKEKLPEITKNISIANLRQSAYEYRKFPKYNMPTEFINSISQNLPIILFSYLFSQKIVGFYGLANMVLRGPVNIMSESISKVFLQKLSEMKNHGSNLYNNLQKTTLGLAVIGIIPFAVLTIAGKQIFGFVFGQEWSEAGLYAQVLAPWLFLAFIASPANQIYIVLQKLKFKLHFNIINIALKVSAIILGYLLFKTPVSAVTFFSITGVIMHVYYISYAFNLAKKSY
ncbi:MAG: oligosaccharide flippase family protein [Candidatus Omnitrophica bacterium]|nr:oligosaccharide flippase family protein [Candidatus Omnitrophota bacterium]